ncbi:hypothetical protein SAMN05444161_1674 [Rhizobiales bacterium GAS191]|nr:hypothetical protein SAMN05444161_1674 [Rhizobiales bacterium GAS191]
MAVLPNPRHERGERESVATKKAAKVYSIDRLWVLARLVDNVNRAMQGKKVTARGAPTGEYRYDGSVANRALELIGKELGMFVERNENATVQHVISDEPLTPEQWKERYVRKDN